MNRSVPWVLLLAALAAAPLRAESSSDQRKTVVDYLSSKAFRGDAERYAQADIQESVVPEKVRQALDALGASHYALLRNEIIARRGYRFQDPLLEDIFHRASWYHYDPQFDLSKLSPVEQRNMNFIKTTEDEHDQKTVAQWLDRDGGQPYAGNKRVYVGTDMLFARMPPGLPLALKHLDTTAARMLSLEVYARRGFIFSGDSALVPAAPKIFAKTRWYRGSEKPTARIPAGLNDNERLNHQLLGLAAQSEALDFVDKLTLPADTVAVPTTDGSAVYIRALRRGSDDYYFLSKDLDEALTIDAKALDDHKTDVQSLLSKDDVYLIERTPDPYEKLTKFLDGKKYRGYADSVLFNHSDFQPPSYLQEALSRTRIDYLHLLATEIRLRIGVPALDKSLAKPFIYTGWYLALYGPKGIHPSRGYHKSTKAELQNLAFLEGERLHTLMQQRPGERLVLAPSGSVAWWKTGTVKIGKGRNDTLGIAKLCGAKEDCAKLDLQKTVDGVIRQYPRAVLSR